MQISPHKTLSFRFYISSLIMSAHVVGLTIFTVGPTLMADLSLSISQFDIALVSASTLLAILFDSWVVHVHKKTMGLRFSQKQKLIWWLCALIVNPLSLAFIYQFVL